MAPPIIIHDFTKICRCCMEVASYDIFKTYFENEPLSKLLFTCTNLKVPRNDVLPINICQSCLQQLISAYIFNQKVKKTQTAICEIAKVLDKAKLKKSQNISSEHDYHNVQRNKAGFQIIEQVGEQSEEQSAAANITPIKIEMETNEDGYGEYEIQPEMQHVDVKFIKDQDGEEEQEYWLEEGHEGGAESAEGAEQGIENYGEMDNIFHAVKNMNSLTQYPTEETNYIEDEDQEQEAEYETLAEYQDGVAEQVR
ncbi:hypothetical protein WA026_017274 [Henosepilachna vigintioctopunctata]|uniref:ZAD domain-containing protein n=1 Tax=Henosepilachna vigintioctopunctata TaxID=420089 RepID=A0AAW1ULT7_9CUCU